MSSEFPQFQNKDLFMISSIAIKPNARGQGAGIALYIKAKELSNNKCIGILYESNIPGQNLAKKAGFVEIPENTFSQNYSYINKRHVVDKKGPFTLRWNLYTPLNMA